MIELVTVMVIVGILATFAAAHFIDRKQFDAAEFSDQTKTLLRYGQKIAIAQQRFVYVRLDGKSVALCFDTGCTAANRVIPASGNNSGSTATLADCDAANLAWACEGAPLNVAYQTTPAITQLYFDSAGRPFATGGAALAETVISISGDTVAHTVTVEAETGYVF
jgi:MSHA pilin protein MshC